MPTVIIPPTDVSPNTGTGSEVLSTGATLTSPILVTPNIGAATGTSFNLSGSGTLGTTLTVNGTTDSSSKDTGAIVTEGGLGVEKSATFGGNLTVNGTGTSAFSGAIKARSTGADEVGIGPYGTGTGGLYFGNGTVSLFNDANTQLKSLVGLSLAGNLTVSGGTITGGSITTALAPSGSTSHRVDVFAGAANQSSNVTFYNSGSAGAGNASYGRIGMLSNTNFRDFTIDTGANGTGVRGSILLNVGASGTVSTDGNLQIGGTPNLAPSTIDRYSSVNVTNVADFPAFSLSVADGSKNVRGSMYIDSSTTQEQFAWDFSYSSASFPQYRWKIAGNTLATLRENGNFILSSTGNDGGQKLQVDGTASITGAVSIGSTLNFDTGNAAGTRTIVLGSTYNSGRWDILNGSTAIGSISAAGGFASNVGFRAAVGSGPTTADYGWAGSSGFYSPSVNVVSLTNNNSRVASWSTTAMTLDYTTASTTTTGGALVVSGGVGVAGAVNVGTYYGMVDGVTAPAATSGYAKIYVDTADGDLKVIFGDGTIKTIATDT